MLNRNFASNLTVRFARSDTEKRAAQRLRYRVFVEELGAAAPALQRDLQCEFDCFDEECLHLCLFDQALEASDPENAVIGVYRLIDESTAKKIGAFYSESEYDLGNILKLEGKKLELGRSCIDPKYRDGSAVSMLWSALGRYIQEENIRYLFGAASYLGTDLENKRDSLSYLHHKFLAPTHLRSQVLAARALDFTPMPLAHINPLVAMRNTPSLIKSYLRIGGKIGAGICVDHDFNTLDLFVILDTTSTIEKFKVMYQPK